MSESSAISWTKSTFNAWIGCTKVGPGCDHCYAEKLDATGRFGSPHWGAGVPRRRTSAGNWAEVRKWNRKAPATRFAGRDGFWPVFLGSLMDWADNEVPPDWRRDMWALVKECRNLTFIMVTKRIGNAARMLPDDWGPHGYPNVWLIATVVNQEEAERDIPKLLALPAHVRGLSCEPLLGPIDLVLAGGLRERAARGFRHVGDRAEETEADWTESAGLDWVIVGGESLAGGQARPMQRAWAVDLLRQCDSANVAYHFKQMGHWLAAEYGLADKGKDPARWPAEFQVQEFPEAA